MASSDVREFNWYQRYKVTAEDMNNQQKWLLEADRMYNEGHSASTVLTGLEPTLTSGLSVTISDGICVGPSGRVMNLTSIGTKTFASPSGNPAKSLIVARPKITPTTLIAQPTNPLNTVYLHNQIEAEVIVIDGTPAASPSYPATQANDCILFGVTLTTAQATLAAANIDFSVRKGKDLFPTASVTSRIIGAGVTIYHPYLDIPTGQTWSGAGNVHAPGLVTGGGTLAISGTLLS